MQGSISTSERIVRIRENNPCLTLERIGEVVGTTREYARQILAKKGLPTAAYKMPKAYCQNCNNPIFRKNKAFCSKECSKEFNRNQYIKLSCEVCGGLVERSAKLYIWEVNKRGYNHVFCDHHCQGKWLGKNYGFGKYPKHQGRK